MIAAVSFLVMIGLMLFNVPIAICTGFAAITGIIMSDGVSFMTFVQRMYVGMDSFTLIAVPLFMLCGRFMALGGITKDLINLSNALVGRFKGGLLYINVVASMFFAGITGSAAADTASVGGILIPTTIDKGYDKDVTVAVTATSSTIGVMIPPSQNMLFYAVAAGSGLSISTLLICGYMPGILLTAGLAVVAWVLAKKRNYPVSKYDLKGQRLRVTIEALAGLMAIVIILVGTTCGICSGGQTRRKERPVGREGLAVLMGLSYLFRLEGARAPAAGCPKGRRPAP